MNATKVFLLVTSSSMAGLVLGGLFGCAAGLLTPDLFRDIIPWRNVEPIGVATFFGAVAGVLLGGGLGVFAVVVQLFSAFKLAKSPPDLSAGQSKV